MDPIKTFELEVITPAGRLYAGPIRSLIFPGIDGFIGVLPRHAPMAALVGPEVVRFRDSEGRERRMAVSGGFAQIRGRRFVLTADAAEMGEQIDMERALSALSRARERLARCALEPKIDALRAELSMRRALARLHAARPGLGLKQSRPTGGQTP